MSPIAILSGEATIYWSSLVIAFGLAACLCLSLALYLPHGGRSAGMALFMCLTVFFSVPLCRILHWYCHMEQYGSIMAALTDFSIGSYCIPGILPAALLSALLVYKLGFADSIGKLLDAFVPGACLGLAFIRLSALFDVTCRGKMSFQQPFLQHLPLASAVTNSSGGVDYRFATFFVHFIILLLMSFLMLRVYGKRRKTPMLSGSESGHVARLFLLYYCAVELVLDSTRYDASFMPFNSFISMVQVICALCMLSLLVYYSIHAIRSRGMSFKVALLWILFLLGVALVGGSEYMVQRHSSWYLGCYSVMSVGSLVMVLPIKQLYLLCCHRKKDFAQ